MNVITSFELEKMIRARRIETREGKIPKYVAIIHCVGSRNLCCSRSASNINLINGIS